MISQIHDFLLWFLIASECLTITSLYNKLSQLRKDNSFLRYN